MKKILSSIGWDLVEYLRRAATPFLLKLMFGMTMLACVMIKSCAQQFSHFSFWRTDLSVLFCFVRWGKARTR